jgi:hypothetical protein
METLGAAELKISAEPVLGLTHLLVIVQINLLILHNLPQKDLLISKAEY